MTIERCVRASMLGHLEIEKATFRSLLCCERPFRSCTMVPVSRFAAHIYENKIGRVETRI